MELSEFLLAQISEDEAVARTASPGPWHLNAESDEVLAVDDITVCEGFALSGPQTRATTAHIAHWDPARVLAECEAKRRIVTEFGSECGDYGAPGSELRAERQALADEMGWEFQPHWPEQYAGFCDGCAAAQSADNDHARVLRLLALPYADHPDYRAEWRP